MLLNGCNLILSKLCSTVFIDFSIQPLEAHFEEIRQILLRFPMQLHNSIEFSLIHPFSPPFIHPLKYYSIFKYLFRILKY